MFTTTKISKSIKYALLIGAAPLLTVNTAMAEQTESSADEKVEKIAVTGSRILRPGAVSTSPIMSMDAEELELFQEPEVERIVKLLPGTLPGDGANRNNGSAGTATVNLRGLGTNRTLVLMNGRRMVPYDINGIVDTANIPTALIERVDVVTGGASAVYGSDALAGAINFVLKENFEGAALDYTHSQTGEGDGNKDSISLTLGANLDDDRGNIALSLSWMNREQILLGQRTLGLYGINTYNGANYEQFLSGTPPTPAPAGCNSHPNAVVDGGSTTSIPTRFQIVGAGSSAGQFRDDRSLLGESCSVFNFNPFNFYQTPQERYNATVIGHYDINDDITAYASATFTNTTVETQVAPSGTFGSTFNLPLGNPLIGDQARQYMIDAGNAALAADLLNPAGLNNWNDVNNNGLVDESDYLLVQLRRRTAELGPRDENYTSNQFQLVAGVKGAITDDWEFDASFSYGESNRSSVRGGYTNITNIQNALDVSADADGNAVCNNGDPACVPLDIFGGFGTITPEMASYVTAVALQQRKYDQTVAQVLVNGPVEAINLSGDPLELSFGLEHRQERGDLIPDECLMLAPTSCQGGAGGNILPISGGYKTNELFVEGILPIASGMNMVEALDLEVGYRFADYDSVGEVNTWKLGVTYRPVEQILARVMLQSATRAPNVGEIAAPLGSGLSNADGDPCSVANAAELATNSVLVERCISTGMAAAQVGGVQDIISGQINVLTGSDLDNPPQAEDAKTFTAGLVFTPDLFKNFSFSVDYYDIKIDDYIGTFGTQEVLNACYEGGDTNACSKIQRIAGSLAINGSGVELYTTNLDYVHAEGIEIAANFTVGLDSLGLEGMGEVSFSTTYNHYLTNESQSSVASPVTDCVGYYGNDCTPLSQDRLLQRITWNMDDIMASLLIRYQGGIDMTENQLASRFDAFETIGSYTYVDLVSSYSIGENTKLTFGIDNLFDKAPPVVGDYAASTPVNSGNTLPSAYDAIGRTFKAGVKFTF